MKTGYRQFCPVAVASEIFAERWTPIILRELVLGSRKFNDIHRGVPRMSRALLATVDAAMDVTGGAAFFRVNGLARLFRDAQGARYHPLQEGLQKALAARAALGMEI